MLRRCGWFVDARLDADSVCTDDTVAFGEVALKLGREKTQA